MSITSKDSESGAGAGRGTWLERLRQKLGADSPRASGVGQKLPPISEIVARTGRKARDEG